MYYCSSEPPKIDVPSDYGIKTIALGSKASFFTCRATGKPKPTISWKNPAGEMVDVEHENRLSIIGDTLIIDPTRAEDKGNWTCEARNPFGSDSLPFPLDFLPCKCKSVPRR